MSDAFRSREVLLAENALLRQQLIILHRQGEKSAQLTKADRLRRGDLVSLHPLLAKYPAHCSAGHFTSLALRSISIILAE